MDSCEYNTIMDAMQEIADPRKPRCQRHSWTMLLTAMRHTAASVQRALSFVGALASVTLT